MLLEPSLLVEQPKLSQPFYIGKVFHPSIIFGVLLWKRSKTFLSFPVLRTPEIDTVSQVGFHQSRGEDPLTCWPHFCFCQRWAVVVMMKFSSYL